MNVSPGDKKVKANIPFRVRFEEVLKDSKPSTAKLMVWMDNNYSNQKKFTSP